MTPSALPRLAAGRSARARRYSGSDSPATATEPAVNSSRREQTASMTGLRNVRTTVAFYPKTQEPEASATETRAGRVSDGEDVTRSERCRPALKDGSTQTSRVNPAGPRRLPVRVSSPRRSPVHRACFCRPVVHGRPYPHRACQDCPSLTLPAPGLPYIPFVGVTFSSTSLPSRFPFPFPAPPGLPCPAASYRSFMLSVQRPSSVSGRSPFFMPAFPAAPLGTTAVTSTPSSSSPLSLVQTRP